MERISIKEAYFLVPGSLVPWDQHKARGQVGAVAQRLPHGGPSREHEEGRLQVHRHKWSHVEQVVVPEEEKVMSIVETLDVVHVVVQQIPLPVKLVDGERGKFCYACLHPYADQTLRNK